MVGLTDPKLDVRSRAPMSSHDQAESSQVGMDLATPTSDDCAPTEVTTAEEDAPLRGGSVADWPDPPDVPGVPTPLPLDALPDALRDQVENVADYLQVPADLPMMLGLATVSAAVVGHVVVRARSEWTEPIGIYTACILPPASRKSPAYAAMTAPLREWEAESICAALPRVLAAQDVVDVAEKKLESLKKKAVTGKAAPDEIESARLDLQKAISMVPPDGRLLAGDITAEAMVQRMAAQGGRLAILEPEPGPLQLLGGRYSDSARLDELKKAWSGEAIIVDRVNRPPLRVPCPALALALCLQTGVLESLRNRESFRLEGVFGRILWCKPAPGLGTRLTGAAVPPRNEAAQRAFVRIVRTLLGMKPRSYDDGTPQPHIIDLSPEALEAHHDFEAEVEPELADGARYGGIGDWAGKMVGQSVRIAALLELASRAGSRASLLDGPISRRSMENAVAIVRALGSHALAVLGPTNKSAALLRYVLNRARNLVQNPPPLENGGASLRNLYELTKGRSAIESMDDLTAIVEELVECGCVRLLGTPTNGPGRPPSPTVEVHPSLLESIRTIRTIRDGSMDLDDLLDVGVLP